MKPGSLFSRKLGLALFAAALVIGFAFVVARSGPLAPTQVTTVRVASGTVSPALFGIGTVEARRSYFIGPTAAGRVKAIHVDIGESVQAGQLLAEIEPVDLDERLRSSEAAQARAASAVVSAEAQRNDVLARLKVAELNAQRYRELGGKHFVSASAVESRQQELASAQAAVEASNANLQGARQEVTRLEAELAGLQQQRDNVRLRAPAHGVVISRDAEAGSTVVAGQAVLRLMEPESLWIRVRLDQGRSAGLIEGLPASIVLRSNPSVPLTGKVARVEATSDSITEERVALVALDTLPSGLSTGELAEVTLTLPATAPALLLPNPAIRRQADQVGVWRLEGGKLHFAPVRIGQTSLDGQVQVLEGLKAGDEVVVYSEKDLSANSRIKVVDTLAGGKP